VTYTPAIFNFVLDFHRVTGQGKLNSKLYTVTASRCAPNVQVWKNVQSDGDSNPDPWTTVPRLYRLSCPVAFSSSSLLWTVLNRDKNLGSLHNLWFLVYSGDVKVNMRNLLNLSLT
jgi:hypothetical protein